MGGSPPVSAATAGLELQPSGSLSRHTYHSDPDPTRFEGDGNYNVMESDGVFWSGLQCFNEKLYTGDYVAARDETVANYYVTLFRLWRPAWEAHARAAGLPGLLMLRGYVPPVKADAYTSPDPFAREGCGWATMAGISSSPRSSARARSAASHRGAAGRDGRGLHQHAGHASVCGPGRNHLQAAFWSRMSGQSAAGRVRRGRSG